MSSLHSKASEDPGREDPGECEGEGHLRRRLGRKGHRGCGEGEGHLRRKDEDRDSWEKSAQGMGAAEGASSTREWATREARCVRAGHRDSPGASKEEARGVWAQGQSRREQGRGAPRGRLGQSRRELGGGASSGTVVVSDIGEAQGQSRREQGRGAPRGRQGQSRRELRDSCSLRYRRCSGTVPARAGQRRAAWEAGRVLARAGERCAAWEAGDSPGASWKEAGAQGQSRRE
jgi:hypothetical protein